ncbi:hypothetical protein WSM22_47490 [Cytophagales bacterium WSM2-2]|nr:hypothetical protein WSM22_47490 [Cytophagales bacterium WSM2-2]
MRALLLFVFLIGCCNGVAQSTTPILERKISIELVNEKLPVALERIGRQGGFSFSYNSAIISTTQVVTIKVSGKTIREVLEMIFKGSMQYKEKAKHVILTQTPVQSKVSRTTVIVLSGYVEDEKSGEKVPDVSLFEKETLASSVTDQYGYYTIKLDDTKGKVELNIRKRNYRDTVIAITTPGNNTLNISIRPITKDSVVIIAQAESTDTTRQENESITEVKKEKFGLPYMQDANIQNIHDTLYRQAQISFAPFVGSNGKLSGNVINNYSFNVFSGYSLGTRQMEFGGFVNIDRGDVSWLQLAGFGNMVGRNVYGVQAAGFFNLNGGETKAWQMAGFANVNFGETRGVQLAGFGNTNLNSSHAVQLAGFFNFSKGPGVGVQIAGYTNVQLGEYRGSQFAGFVNVNTKEIHGVQVAGFANIASGKVGGSQVAGLFNYGKKVKGTQLGLINVADTLGGVPIGLVSFVKHGYHKLELSADEVFHANMSFRTGVKDFYNILFAGIKPDPSPDNANVWTFGYGVGTERKITRWLHVNLDITSQQINKGGFTHATDLLNKVHAGLDFRISKEFSIYGGATLNGYLTENSFTDYPVLFSNQTPSIFYDHSIGDNHNLKMWLGWKVGLRFF